MSTENKHRIWYDQVTKQILGYSMNHDPANSFQFPGAQIIDVDDTAMAALNGKNQYHFLYDETIQMAVPKPHFVLTPDKPSAALGGEVITVRVTLVDNLGNPMPWVAVQIKDIAEKANISAASITYQEGEFRVRSFVPGIAKINVKEVWDGATRIKCTGGQFFHFSNADILELKFTQAAF